MPYSNRHLNLHYLPLLAKALNGLFPKVELLGGGISDYGFYYDFILEGVEFDTDFLKSVEERLHGFQREGVAVSSIEMMRDVAVNYLRHHRQKSKALIINEEYSPGVLSLLQVDEFLEVVNEEIELLPLNQLKHFELYDVGVSGEGGVVRLYGAAFPSNKELKDFRKKMKAFFGFDHLTLAEGMLLYQYFPLMAEGVWLPKGVVLLNVLLSLWHEFCHHNNIQEIRTGSSTDEEFFEKSALLKVGAVGELLTIQREVSLEKCKGMWRLNKFFADRTCRTGDLADVQKLLNSSLQSIMKTVNILGSDCCWVLCTPTTGPFAQKQPMLELQKALETSGISYTKECVEESDGTEPRAYCLIPDGMGRYWKGPFVGLKYDKKLQQAVVSCSLFGSIERIVASVLEQYRGELPFILAPEHVRLVSMPNQNQFTEQVRKRLIDEGFRVGIDQTDKRLAEKIHSAEKEKIPFIAVIGEAEAKNSTLTLRGCNKDDKQRKVTINDLLDELHRENIEKSPSAVKRTKRGD